MGILVQLSFLSSQIDWIERLLSCHKGNRPYENVQRLEPIGQVCLHQVGEGRGEGRIKSHCELSCFSNICVGVCMCVCGVCGVCGVVCVRVVCVV